MPGGNTTDGRMANGVPFPDNSSTGSSSNPDNSKTNQEMLDYLKSISDNISSLVKDGMPSQSEARQRNDSDSFRHPFTRRDIKSGVNQAKSSFTDGFEDALMEGLLGADFKKKIGGALNNFADAIGVNLEDLPGTIGKELGKQAIDKFKGTELGKKADEYLGKAKGKAVGWAKDQFMGGVEKYDAKNGTDFVSQFSSLFGGSSSAAAASGAAEAGAAMAETTAAATQAGEALAVVGEAGGAAAAGTSAAGAAAAGLATAAAPLAIALVAVTAAAVVLGPAIEGLGKLFKSLGNAAMRMHDEQKKNTEAAKQRQKDDIETIVKAPFEILEQAAQKIYETWDANLRMINATQGYTKADLQSLMADYANRLRQEGLTNVVSVADITDSLSSVLKAGLSGAIANEFAYLATKLNAAIPTQDFFGYADTYASIAANQIRLGASQEEAIAAANEQLELFASNVLYSSRQLAGGFNAGLKDAQTLFEHSVRIAETARTGNASQISGVMTAVAAITGAIAPDLASSVIEAVYKAAVGGNSSEIVALRSLAGINASNTEFLNAFARNPQGVFGSIFRKLATYQNMSPDAFMEVAEGVSSIFGMSMDAFARVDFNYLADAIAHMNVNDSSLQENVELLKSGQTTTTKEMLKVAQINEYLIDEGLSYVLDNEVARTIQQHMWQEQQTRELTAATYGIEIKGAAMDALQGIMQTIDNILMFLMPWKILPNVVGNIAKSVAEGNALEKDVKQVLELGKVGDGNAKALYQLTTRNRDLGLVPTLVELMGGKSNYRAAGAGWDAINEIAARKVSAPFGGGLLAGGGLLPSQLLYGKGRSFSTGYAGNAVASKYLWGVVSKSGANAYSDLASALSLSASGSSISRRAASADVSQSIISSKIEEMLADEYMGTKYAKAGKSYEEFAASAKSMGISDFSKALEEAGYSEQDIKGKFQQYQTQEGMAEKAARDEIEMTFWQTMIKYTPQIHDGLFIGPDSFQSRVDMLLTQTVEQITLANTSYLDPMNKNLKEFWTNWNSYILQHTVYNDAYTFDDVRRVNEEYKAKGEEAVAYALADVLTKNLSPSLDALQDPTVQTNLLLSQILVVIRAIMDQTKGGGTSLLDSITALSLGASTPTAI